MDYTNEIVEAIDDLAMARACQRAAEVGGDFEAEEKWLHRARKAKKQLKMLLQELQDGRRED